MFIDRHPVSCVCEDCVEESNMICQCTEPEFEGSTCNICGREEE